MTLLELLVKELSGAWPVEADGAVQDSSGQIWFYKNDKPKFTGGIWVADNNSNSVDWVQWELRFKRSEDYKKSIVTREQYEAAIAAQASSRQPVWNGEGLPPVGYKCEYIGNDTSWGVVKVIGYDEGRVVFKPSGEDYYGITPSYKAVFRPLHTEEERKREEAIAEMASTPKPCSYAIYDICAQLYDAGYRKAGLTDDHMD